MKSKNKYLFALLLITIAGFILRLVMAHMDPFLHDWDERYHALVARNMMDHPLTPMLRKSPLLPVDSFSWTNGHIWVHKQPLFLWQMAASMKLFGVNEFSIRYPSVIMGTLMIPMLYAITRYFTGEKVIALIAAALLCLSNFQLELTAGIKGMDHNDIALGFYVLASTFAWIRYREKLTWKQALLVGVFAGCAILNKWLYGLYIFLVWGVFIIVNHKREFNKQEVFYFLLALGACCAVFVPWQVYILHRFPAEARFEYEYNRRHITEALESHTGSVWYYLGHFAQLFGEGTWLLIFPGLFLFFRLPAAEKKLYLPFLSGMIFLFVFLSFFVKTKVVGHFYFSAPFFLIFMAISIKYLLDLARRPVFKLALCLLLVILLWKPEKTIAYVLYNQGRKEKIAQTVLIKSLSSYKGYQDICVVGTENYIEIMFFNNNLTAYGSYPAANELPGLAGKGVRLMAFSSAGNIPAYISVYPYFLPVALPVK